MFLEDAARGHLRAHNSCAWRGSGHGWARRRRGRARLGWVAPVQACSHRGTCKPPQQAARRHPPAIPSEQGLVSIQAQPANCASSCGRATPAIVVIYSQPSPLLAVRGCSRGTVVSKEGLRGLDEMPRVAPPRSNGSSGPPDLPRTSTRP
jgi:hypothetical protein